MRRQLCIACFIAGIAAFAHADTLTLTVGDANTTNTLSEALSAIGRTVADLNGGDYAAYDIVKAGDGDVAWRVHHSPRQLFRRLRQVRASGLVRV